MSNKDKKSHIPLKAERHKEQARTAYWTARNKHAGYIEGTPCKENWRAVIHPAGEALPLKSPRMYSEMAASRLLIEWRKAFKHDGTAMAKESPTIDCAVVVDKKGPPVFFRVIRPPE